MTGRTRARTVSGLVGRHSMLRLTWRSRNRAAVPRRPGGPGGCGCGGGLRAHTSSARRSKGRVDATARSRLRALLPGRVEVRLGLARRFPRGYPKRSTVCGTVLPMTAGRRPPLSVRHERPPLLLEQVDVRERDGQPLVEPCGWSRMIPCAVSAAVRFCHDCAPHSRLILPGRSAPADHPAEVSPIDRAPGVLADPGASS